VNDLAPPARLVHVSSPAAPPAQPQENVMSTPARRRQLRLRDRLAGRSLRLQSGMTLLEILIVLAILALVMGLLIGPRIFAMFGQGKEGVAKAMTKKLAHEAFPQWSMKPANSGKGCPSADDLGAFEDQKPGFKDPWGNPYKVVCGGPQGITVTSMGPNGAEGGGDDLSSNDD
jgi:general secretion pathway protein G